MTADTHSASKRLLVLLSIAAALAATAITRLNLTYDLGFFLPAPANNAQRVLVERLGEGPGTQLIFAAVSAQQTEQSTTSRLGDAAEALRGIPGVLQVLPDSDALSRGAIPNALWQRRFLLAELPASVAEWQQVLDLRASDALLADESALQMITADPALAALAAFEQMAATSHEPDFRGTGSDGRAEHYLLLQTRSGAFAIDDQAELVAAIRTTLARHFAAVRLYGSGVYSVDLQASVQRESVLFSVLASVALAALVYLRFRQLPIVLAVGLPLVVGGLAGLLALTLLFDRVHGITLAFGFTLLGVAIDYPLHLFSHPSTRRVWPTLLLGISSTLVAYLAFVAAGTVGLQQLGVFAVVGILGATLASRYLTANEAQPLERNEQTSAAQPAGLTHWPWIVCALLSGSLMLERSLFSDDLGKMTPVASATLAADAKLRHQLGVADMRNLISVQHSDLQLLLVELSRVSKTLEQQVNAGTLNGFQSISALLPTTERQHARLNALKQPPLLEQFNQAVEESVFTRDAFQPFFDDVQALQTQPLAHALITPELLASSGEQLAQLTQSLLYNNGIDWVALVYLRGLTEDADARAALEQQIGQLRNAELIDLKAASMSLVADYRARVLRILGIALLAIAALLLLTTRAPSRVLWLLGTLLAAVMASVAVNYHILGGLSLFDLIALALVAGLGLDYGLFFSKAERSSADQHNTAAAIGLCAASSFLVFGILALSSIPLLRGLGLTVATGVAVAYLLTRYGRANRESRPGIESP